MSFTNSEFADEVLEWIASYRMLVDDAEVVQLGEGIMLGAALAIRHPEYLAAFSQALCKGLDDELIPMSDGECEPGHTWSEHQDLVDLLVEQCPVRS